MPQVATILRARCLGKDRAVTFNQLVIVVIDDSILNAVQKNVSEYVAEIVRNNGYSHLVNARSNGI